MPPSDRVPTVSPTVSPSGSRTTVSRVPLPTGHGHGRTVSRDTVTRRVTVNSSTSPNSTLSTHPDPTGRTATMSPTTDEPIEILDDEDQVTDVIPSQPHEPELRHLMDDACWCGPVRQDVTEVREAPVGRNRVRAVPGAVTSLRLHREAAAPVESSAVEEPVEGAWPTPEQWVERFMSKDAPHRRVMAGAAISAAMSSIRCIEENHDGLRRERDAMAEKLGRVIAMTFASDDGTEFEHNGHDAGLGEPECPGCWAEGIRAALDGPR